MPPFLPVIGISRSQNVRLGRGPGASVVSELSLGDTPGVNPQTGYVQVPFFVDIGDSYARKDLQHHSAIGAVIPVGALSQTVSSDFYRSAGLAVTAGTGTSVNLASGTLTSRTYGNTLAVAAQAGLAIAASSGTLDRTDRVVVNNQGIASVITGAFAAAGTSVAPPPAANTVSVATVLVPAAAATSAGYTIAAAYPTA